MIQCERLSRWYGTVRAVDELTFAVRPGCICALLGPNGAGKSTTVRMLTGLEAPSSGTALVCGIPVTQYSPALRRRAGVLPEGLGLFDRLSVAEHLELTGDLHGLPAVESRARTAELLSLLDFDSAHRTHARHCSQGMRKKLALAMAILANPEVLFLDEPFEAMDPPSVSVVSRILVKAASRGATILLTSHILEAVQRVASQFAVLQAGRCIHQAGPGEPVPSAEEIYPVPDGRPEEGLQWLGHS